MTFGSVLPSLDKMVTPMLAGLQYDRLGISGALPATSFAIPFVLLTAVAVVGAISRSSLGLHSRLSAYMGMLVKTLILMIGILILVDVGRELATGRGGLSHMLRFGLPTMLAVAVSIVVGLGVFSIDLEARSSANHALEWTLAFAMSFAIYLVIYEPVSRGIIITNVRNTLDITSLGSVSFASTVYSAYAELPTLIRTGIWLTIILVALKYSWRMAQPLLRLLLQVLLVAALTLGTLTIVVGFGEGWASATRQEWILAPLHHSYVVLQHQVSTWLQKLGAMPTIEMIELQVQNYFANAGPELRSYVYGHLTDANELHRQLFVGSVAMVILGLLAVRWLLYYPVRIAIVLSFIPGLIALSFGASLEVFLLVVGLQVLLWSLVVLKWPGWINTGNQRMAATLVLSGGLGLWLGMLITGMGNSPSAEVPSVATSLIISVLICAAATGGLMATHENAENLRRPLLVLLTILSSGLIIMFVLALDSDFLLLVLAGRWKEAAVNLAVRWNSIVITGMLAALALLNTLLLILREWMARWLKGFSDHDPISDDPIFVATWLGMAVSPIIALAAQPVWLSLLGFFGGLILMGLYLSIKQEGADKMAQNGAQAVRSAMKKLPAGIRRYIDPLELRAG